MCDALYLSWEEEKKRVDELTQCLLDAKLLETEAICSAVEKERERGEEALAKAVSLEAACLEESFNQEDASFAESVKKHTY